MEKLPLPLRVLILDNDSASAKVLKAIIETKSDIVAVQTVDRTEIANNVLRNDHFNSLFIDIFSIGTETGVKFIEHVRTAYPTVPICLYSKLIDLRTMPEVNEYWRQRLHHYYKLPKDQTIENLSSGADEMLYSLSTWLQTRIARVKVDNLAKLVEGKGEIIINNEQKNEITEIAAVIEKALKARDEAVSQQINTIVPGVNTEQIETLVNMTLKEATQSLRLTTNVNIGVLIAGSALVLISFIVASITNRWEAVAFGGFGITGIVASLIVNPLKSIGASARRLVQIQVAYLAFVSQLALLNQKSEKVSEFDRSQRLGEEMVRTLKVLEEQSGK